tara:strand:- start:90 stop:284 length:195 start_codon:yes stop_codon:yes gene_type:complete
MNTGPCRHYENKINVLGKVLNVIEIRITVTQASRSATMRMGFKTEKTLINKFEKLKMKMKTVGF